jgi:cytochrome b561
LSQAKDQDEACSTRWSLLMIALHWLCGFLLLFLLALGWLMVHAQYDAAARFDMYQLHKSLGFLALALFLVRGIVRATTTSPKSAPMPIWEQRSAKGAHFGLYLLSLIAILSGWLVVSSAIVAVPSRLFDMFVIPNIPGVGVAQFGFAQSLHFLSVWGLAALVLLHISAALKNHFINRDAILTRMLPRFRRAG